MLASPKMPGRSDLSEACGSARACRPHCPASWRRQRPLNPVPPFGSRISQAVPAGRTGWSTPRRATTSRTQPSLGPATTGAASRPGPPLAAAPGRGLGPPMERVRRIPTGTGRSTTPVPTTSAAEPLRRRSTRPASPGTADCGSPTREAVSGAPTTRWQRSRPGSSSRRRSSTTTWRRWRSIPTTRRPTRSGQEPANRTPAAAAARPVWASTRRRTVASHGRARSVRRSSRAGRSDRSPCSLAIRMSSSRPRVAACWACRTPAAVVWMP